MLAESSPLQRVGSAALRAYGSSGRQSFGELMEASNQQLLQNEMAAGDMLRQDAQIEMQMSASQRAEAMDMVTLAQTLTQGAEPGSMQRLLQHWEEAPEDFSQMEAGDRISALISSASGAGIRPAAETFTSGRHIIERDPETGQYRIAFSAPVDRPAGSGLPQTTGLPEGWMWGRDEAGNATAMRIPGLEGGTEMPYRVLTDQEVTQYGLVPGTVYQMDDEGKITTVDDTMRMEVVPETGAVRALDLVTGTATEVPIGSVTPPAAPPPVTGPTIYDLIGREEVAGIGSALTETWAQTGGQVFGVGPETQETIEARQYVTSAVQELVRALSVNDRFPVAEMERIREEVNIEPSMWDSAESAQASARGLDRALRDRLASAEADAANTALPQATREAQASNASAIRNFLTRLGVPQGAAQGTPTAAEAWAEIRNAPPGVGQTVWDGMDAQQRADVMRAWPNMTEAERALFQ
jgi:hypothetical protein